MIGIFAFFLILIALFSTRMHFHDTLEYINIAKYFGGVNNVDLFSGHSLFYPFLIGFFLKLWPSLSMIKLVNVSWLFLIGLVFLYWLKDKKAFLIFAFSPLIWYVSIQTTPILPATFFFFISYIFFFKKNIKHNLFYSGIFFGLACAFYTPMMALGFIFVLIYFWKKKFPDFIKYLVALFIGFVPRLLLDYHLFKNPFYSLIRYIGCNLTVFLGVNTSMGFINFFSNLYIFSIIILISPFLFRLYRLEFKKYKKSLIVIIVISIILIVRMPLLNLFLIISPLIVILLSKVLSDKELKWHCILSIILILFLTWGYFGTTEDSLIQKDMESISQDYQVDYIIGGPMKALKLAMFSWKDKPYFVWYQDFEASLKNKTIIRDYEISFESKIPLKSKFRIIGRFDRYRNTTYENYILVEEKSKTLEDFEKDRCYEKLCVYK